MAVIHRSRPNVAGQSEAGLRGRPSDAPFWPKACAEEGPVRRRRSCETQRERQPSSSRRIQPQSHDRTGFRSLALRAADPSLRPLRRWPELQDAPPGALQAPPALCLPARFSRFAASPSGVAPVAQQNALRASRALTTALNCIARRLQSASSSSTQPVAPSSRAIGLGSSVVSTVKPRVAGPPKHACGATQVIQQFRQ